jgi:plasmid stabilization system protein ParE
VKPLQISEPASQELAEAVRWYEERRPGWGARLFDAVSRAFDLIERHAEIGAPRGSQPAVRQLAVRGFPYLVVYRTRPDDSYVVALAHTSRRPGYWKDRR